MADTAALPGPEPSVILRGNDYLFESRMIE